MSCQIDVNCQVLVLFLDNALYNTTTDFEIFVKQKIKLNRKKVNKTIAFRSPNFFFSLFFCALIDNIVDF
jgi:hypothetical protein